MSCDLAEVKKIFLDALLRPTAEGRRARVREACGDDLELHDCVLAMLDAHERYATPVPEDLSTDATGPVNVPLQLRMEPGGIVGEKYKIIEFIDNGGMGSVYRATRTDIKMEVALKVIKPGLDTEHVLARFNVERTALAMMNHENIARVLDAGVTEQGRPFFVMELVKGKSLTAYCDEHKLPIRERLELFASVCSAVQHAHQKGIIHRDLKPSNILVGRYDDKAVPKVIDFGLAKAVDRRLTDDSLHTYFDTIVGTRLYMAPEQAQLNNLDIDTRADIYSLGVILYELLTGETPLDANRIKGLSNVEVQRLIREEVPPRPSDKIHSSADKQSIASQRSTEPTRLQKQVRGDLNWIVMKALEKDRNRRYESAKDLADEIRRYLLGEAVEAGPPTLWYTTSKFIHKHRAKALVFSLLASTITVGSVVSAVGWIKASEASSKATSAAEAAEKEKTRAENMALLTKLTNRFWSDEVIGQIDPAIRSQLGQDYIRKISLKDALDRASANVGNRLVDHPLEEAAIRLSIGKAYSGIGDFKSARVHLAKSEELRRRASGPEDPDRLESLYELGWAMNLGGEPHAAEPKLREAAEVRVKIRGEANLEACKSRFALAAALASMERYDEAIGILTDVLGKQKATLTMRHRDTLATQRELANCLQWKKDFKLAEKYMREVLEIERDFLGRHDPDTLSASNDLAVIISDDENPEKKIAEATKLLAEVVHESKSLYGPSHPEYLISCTNYAGVLNNARRFKEAIDICRQTIPELKCVCGPKSEPTLGALLAEAAAHCGLDEPQKAAPLLLEVYAGCRDGELGETSERAKFVINNLIDVFGRMNKPAEVKKWQEVLEIANKKPK
jgi:serine/threonine protein kinase